MVVMAHRLIRLGGDENWQSWGDDWMGHVETLVLDLSVPLSNYHVAPRWLREKVDSRLLDWGAWLYEVTREDLLRILAEVGPPRNDWRQEKMQQELSLVGDLDPDRRYGLIWIEAG